MVEISTPNLPSRDFEETERFYAQFGFIRGFKEDGWMLLHRGSAGNRLVLEFFHHPDLDPATSWFSACIRTDDLPSFVKMLEDSDVPLQNEGVPRYQAPKTEESGLTIAYLVDCDGSLIRLIQLD